MIKITINKKTPTINHLYYHIKNMKVLTKEARTIRKYIEGVVKTIDCKNLIGKPLKVSISIYEDWLTKKGEIKKKDISNREKFLVDSIFKAIGLDDKHIFDLRYVKVQSNEEKAVVEIEELK